MEVFPLLLFPIRSTCTSERTKRGIAILSCGLTLWRPWLAKLDRRSLHATTKLTGGACTVFPSYKAVLPFHTPVAAAGASVSLSGALVAVAPGVVRLPAAALLLSLCALRCRFENSVSVSLGKLKAFNCVYNPSGTTDTPANVLGA